VCKIRFHRKVSGRRGDFMVQSGMDGRSSRNILKDRTEKLTDKMKDREVEVYLHATVLMSEVCDCIHTRFMLPGGDRDSEQLFSSAGNRRAFHKMI